MISPSSRMDVPAGMPGKNGISIDFLNKTGEAMCKFAALYD